MRQVKVSRAFTALAVMFSSSAFGGSLDGKLSGNVEIDFDPVMTTETIKDPEGTGKTTTSTTEMHTSGEAKIIASGRKTAGNYFGLGRAVIEAGIDGSLAADEVIGQFGTKMWDIKLGRFEGDGSYNDGPDIHLVDAPNGVSAYEGNDASEGNIGTAFNLNVGPQIQLYMPSHSGEETTVKGFRPRIRYNIANIGLQLAYESLSEELVSTSKVNGVKSPMKTPSLVTTGYSLSVSFDFGKVSGGLSHAGREKVSKKALIKDDDGKITGNSDDTVTNTTATNVVFVNMGVGSDSIALGAVMTAHTDETKPMAGNKSTTDYTHNQYYLSYVKNLSVEGAAVKFGLTMADADKKVKGDSTKYSSTAMGFRIRYYYSF